MRTIVAISLLVALAASISVSKTELCWEPMFAPGDPSLPQIVMDMACPDPNLCYLAGGSNGVGFGVYKYDGKENGNVEQMNMVNMSMMVLAVEAGGSASAPKGAAGGVSTFFTPQFPPEHYLSNGTWLPSLTPFEFAEATPNIRATKDGMNVVACDGGEPAGIFYSQDGGQMYTLTNLTGFPSKGMKNCSAPGNMAMIDANNWYLLIGQEPQTPSSSSSSSSSFGGQTQSKNVVGRGSRNRVSVTMENQGGVPKLHLEYNTPAKRNLKSGETCIGYSIEILRTTNAGKTWEVQLIDTDSTYTLFDIDCIEGSTTCVSVGGGNNFGVVYMTTDGKTWKKVFTANGNENGIPYFNTVRFVNSSEIWIGGEFGDPSTQSAEGLFYFSKDGGSTWLQYPQLQPMVATIMSLAFVNGEGFASALTMEQDSNILRYASQQYYGYFEQKVCLDGACSFLCQLNTFPQGMCIPTNGGSVKVWCGNNELITSNYDTTSCVGTPQNSTEPLNTCLNSTQGTYFENICNGTSVREVPQVVNARQAFRHTTGYKKHY